MTTGDTLEISGATGAAAHATAVLVPRVATTQLVFRPAVAMLVGVKVAEAVPLVEVVLDEGEIVPAPGPLTVQLMGSPDSSVVVVPPTVTVAVYGVPPAVNVYVVGLSVTAIVVVGSIVHTVNVFPL